MNDNESRECEATESTICRLEWIAMAMDAARRYKESEQLARNGARHVHEARTADDEMR